MNEKMKGIAITSVYDEKKFISEVNDEPSETVTTGYIPIDEQVKMIIRGEITVGNFDRGFENSTDDIDSADPEEYFEDATDFDTESELSEALAAETSKRSADNQTSQQEEVATQASAASETTQANEASE